MTAAILPASVRRVPVPAVARARRTTLADLAVRATRLGCALMLIATMTSVVLKLAGME